MTDRASVPVATGPVLAVRWAPDLNISPGAVSDLQLLTSPISYTWFDEFSVTVPLVLRILGPNPPHKTTECGIIVPAVTSFLSTPSVCGGDATRFTHVVCEPPSGCMI